MYENFKHYSKLEIRDELSKLIGEKLISVDTTRLESDSGLRLYGGFRILTNKTIMTILHKITCCEFCSFTENGLMPVQKDEILGTSVIFGYDAEEGLESDEGYTIISLDFLTENGWYTKTMYIDTTISHRCPIVPEFYMTIEDRTPRCLYARKK
jgi:hypothetical protein